MNVGCFMALCVCFIVLQHCEHWGKMMANIAIPEDPFALKSFECYINTTSCSSLPQGSRQCQTKIWNHVFQLESWKHVYFYFQAEMLLASSFRRTKLSSFSRSNLTWWLSYCFCVLHSIKKKKSASKFLTSSVICKFMVSKLKSKINSW